MGGVGERARPFVAPGVFKGWRINDDEGRDAEVQLMWSTPPPWE